MANRIFTFDFWNTLGYPNPDFTKARNSILAERLKIKEDEAGRLYGIFKGESENFTESTGSAYYGLRQAISFYQKNMPEDTDAELVVLSGIEDYARICEEFKHNPPEILIEPVYLAHKETETGVGIISNTNFISGATILETLPNEMFDYLDFTLFSDLVGVSKPYYEIFYYGKKIIEKKYHVKVLAENIHHFGDSIKCDVDGAKGAGFNGHLIHKSDISFIVKDVLMRK